MTATEHVAVLTPDERERASRFVFQRDRDQFILVRAWLRRLLGAYLDRAPDTIALVLGPQGKPRLADEPLTDLRFNVSHSRDHALLAFGVGREIGVDVEAINPDLDILDLGRTVFSTDELTALHACAPHDRITRFFQYWTAKEAYIKALGGGLSIPLQDFTVDIQADITVWDVHTTVRDMSPYVVRAIAVPEGYAGAVAASGAEWDVRGGEIQ